MSILRHYIRICKKNLIETTPKYGTNYLKRKGLHLIGAQINSVCAIVSYFEVLFGNFLQFFPTNARHNLKNKPKLPPPKVFPTYSLE
jgi:hypothetical protein